MHHLRFFVEVKKKTEKYVFVRNVVVVPTVPDLPTDKLLGILKSSPSKVDLFFDVQLCSLDAVQCKQRADSYYGG